MPGYYVLNNDRLIQTSRGRLILPLAFHRVTGTPDADGHTIDLRGIAMWYYSDDEGTTWTEAKNWWALPVASVTGMQEPGVVELADGSLLSWSRTDQGRQFENRSRDHGVTWSAPQAMKMFSPASPASIKRLPGSTDLLAVFNDYSGQFPFSLPSSTYRGRTPLVASLSSDGGAAWCTALEQVLAKGSMDARWEASNGMLAQSTTASLPHYIPLLDDAGADTRVGAAMTILYVRARE